MRVNILGMNKCEIATRYGCYLQSYKSIVAFISNEGRITLYRDWDYSVTTAKHVGQWLGISSKDLRKMIKEGRVLKLDEEPDL